MKERADFDKRFSELLHAATGSGRLCELTYVERESRSIGWAEGEPSVQTHSATEGAAIRVQDGSGGEGVVTTKTLEPARLKELTQTAFDIARTSSKDPHRRMARPATYPDEPPMADNLFSETMDTVLERLKEIEKRVLAIDPRLKKVIKFSFSETRARTGLGNTQAVKLVSESTYGSFAAEILAEEAGKTEVAWDYRSHRFPSRIAMDTIAENVASHAVASLGGEAIPSGSYPVLLHPRVGTQLLELLEQALSAEAVQLSRSFLRNLLGAAVASDAVTVVDDPLLPDGVASSAFDDEGTPHRALTPIDRGRLTAYFYDLRSAARAEVQSNGRAVKSGLGAAPHPGATNLYIKPGAASQEQLLSSEDKVFFLHDVMGLHMADPITGEFSLGASGALYENGKRVQTVRGVTIAGTVGGLLKKITAVGNDLTWYGSAGAPSLLVSGLTVAGR